mmetsp:Transcript_10776/g.24622  ORF Transcript_10776/g.24622 Transcript_10776/m.24622 type:complete len:383 (+) Transcript_10776:151-1299(+)
MARPSSRQSGRGSINDPLETGSVTGSVVSSRKAAAKPVALQRVLFGSGDLDQDQVSQKDLEAAFREIDVDASGVIDAGELVNALRLCGLDVSLGATKTVLKEIDKNVSGTIDLPEFIEFFRSLEDMGRFKKRTEQRAKFVSFMLNFCFLISIVAVCVLLLLFINMDEAEDGESYQLMRNILYGSAGLLAILFLLIILVPVARFTLGPNAFSIVKRLQDHQKARKARPPPSHDMGTGPSAGGGGLRHTAAALPGMPEQTPAEIALTSMSYRQGRAPTASSARAPSGRGPVQLPSEGTASGAALPLAPIAASQPAPPPANAFARYDPDAYRNAQYAMDIGQMNTTSFNPMQVRDVHVHHEHTQAPGAVAIMNQYPALSNSAHAG